MVRVSVDVLSRTNVWFWVILSAWVASQKGSKFSNLRTTELISPIRDKNETYVLIFFSELEGASADSTPADTATETKPI